MDSRGDMYANRAALESMSETLRRMFKETDDTKPAPEGALPLDVSVAAKLAPMPRRVRRAFFSLRRRGVDEAEAFARAEEALDR